MPTGSCQFPIAFVLSIGCAVPAWADFRAGSIAYEHSDYAIALREWRLLAAQGNAEAQNSLGVLYAEGHGVPKDYGQAQYWFGKAAPQGLASVHFCLGVLYALGQDVAQDYAHPMLTFSKPI